MKVADPADERAPALPSPEVLAVLRGARVRRVDVPEPDLVAITLLIDRTTATLIVSVSESEPGLGLVDERPRGEPAASFAQLLRKHLSGATIEGVSSPGQGEVRFVFRRDDQVMTLHASVRRRAGGVVLVDASERRLGGAPHGVTSVGETPRAGPDPSEWPRDLDELRVAGRALLARRSGADDHDHHAELRRTLVRARARVARRVAAIESDHAKAEVTPRLRADGTLLLSSLGAVAPRASEVSLVDPATGVERRITLDPAQSGAQNAERFFAKARKLDRGAGIARLRLAEATRELARFDEALLALSAGDVAPAEALVHAPTPRTKRDEPARRVPYRTFVLEDASVVLVGRGARDNDALTFRHAAPDDLFFHARGHTGAHVILRATPGREASDAARSAAAGLAAHFSAARGDTAVDVSCARRRDLRRGRAAGSVVLRTSTTERIRMDDAWLAALLAREIKS